MISKIGENKKKNSTPLELMILRAEKAEYALKDSSKSLAALKIIQKNSYDIIEATKGIVTCLQEVVKKNSKDAAQKNILLKELKLIVEKNRLVLKKRYQNIVKSMISHL